MEDEEGIIGCLYYKIKQNSIKYKFKRSKLKYDILTQTIFFFGKDRLFGYKINYKNNILFSGLVRNTLDFFLYNCTYIQIN